MSTTASATELEKLLLEYIERYGPTKSVRDFYLRQSKNEGAGEGALYRRERFQEHEAKASESSLIEAQGAWGTP